MKKSGISIAALAAIFLASFLQRTAVNAASPSLPREQPSESIATSTVSGTVAAVMATATPTIAPAAPSAADRPVALTIPSINLDDRIIALGVNAKGEMAVPSGKTDDVGWYRYGPVPGAEGSAVLDAHVFAAFRNLKNVPVGADIYVAMRSGGIMHFVVRQSTVYALAGLPSSVLFDHGPGRWLNIITCAGKLTPDHSTYDHRLIVFAELVS